jgi:hypothetical protein
MSETKKTKSYRASLSFVASAALFIFAACAGSQGPDSDCSDGKCDDPGETSMWGCVEKCGLDAFSETLEADMKADECYVECRGGEAAAVCELRRRDALESSQRAFTKDALRWAVADVEGVNTNNGDSRGQEYTEYYAVVHLPPTAEDEEATRFEAGRLLWAWSDEQEDWALDTTPVSIDLTRDQIDTLDLDGEPEDIVGQCIYHSWHSDVPGPLPICNGDDETCPTLDYADSAQTAAYITDKSLVPMNEEYMRMKRTVNSNCAASDLVWRCTADPLVGDASNEADPLHDPWMRGCMKSYELFTTEWRRSDPAVCSVGSRLNECGCGVDTDGDGEAELTTAGFDANNDGVIEGDELNPALLGHAVVPPQPGMGGCDTDGDGEYDIEAPPEGEPITLRGFQLGTWSSIDELPKGCRLVDTGENQRNVVACDLNAQDLINHAHDLKARCNEKYGQNVVVHVPLPGDAIVCNAPDDSAYGETCGDMPWTFPELAQSSEPDLPGLDGPSGDE